jgi:hypothetical protein
MTVVDDVAGVDKNRHDLVEAFAVRAAKPDRFRPGKGDGLKRICEVDHP